MQAATVSALCVLLSLISSPDRAAAQSNPPNTSSPSQVLPAPAKFPDPQGVTETKTVPLGTNSTDVPRNAPQLWISLLAQQDKPSGEQFQAGLKERLKAEILSQVETNRCAHILVFPAPETDSEMVLNVPPDTGGPITTFKALGPCCRDIRPSMEPPQFPGLRRFPRRPPFLQRPFVLPPSAQPKDNNAPGPSLGNSLNHLRP